MDPVARVGSVVHSCRVDDNTASDYWDQFLYAVAVWQIIFKLQTAVIDFMHSKIAEALGLRTKPVAIL